MPEISVIMPVYKAEAYLHRCVDSILAQTFIDFELILVDDGSPDSCGAICNEYAAKDRRIRVIHQKNAGASAARNHGLDLAKGRYLAFCDSDDFVSPGWLKRMLDYAGGKTLSIGASCSTVEALGKERRLTIASGAAYDSKDYICFNNAGIAGYLWNALYRRDVVESLGLRLRERRETGDYNEDLIFAINYVQAIDKIVYTGYSDYYYNTHEDSLSRANQRYYFEKYAEKYRIWDGFIKRYYPERSDLQCDLSTKTLYHFLTAIKEERDFRKVKSIVYSPEMGDCLKTADTSQENQHVISMLRKKHALSLFCFNKAVRIKEII